MFVQSLLNYTQRVVTIPMCGYRYVIEYKHSTYSKYHENWEKAASLVAEETLKLWAKAGICRDEIDRERLLLLSENAQHAVENLFKKGSPLSFVQQCKEVKRLIYADNNVLAAIKNNPNQTRSKSFALFRMCVLTRLSVLITLLFRLIERMRKIL